MFMDKAVQSKNLHLVSDSVPQSVMKRKTVQNRYQDLATIPKKISLVKTFHLTLWEVSRRTTPMQENRRVNRAQAIIIPELAQSRSRNQLIRLERVPGETLCSKKLRASRLHLASMIQFPRKLSLRPLVGESVQSNAKVWSLRVKKECQELVHMPFHLEYLMVQKFTCMLKLTKWIRTSRKTCQDPANMICRTVPVTEMVGPQPTQWAPEVEPI